ncbi:MAG: hypothetical protein LC650_02285 [Actinobacteria bacterium]|nr:hypothetical protein [Actinomycetota bacterium]
MSQVSSTTFLYHQRSYDLVKYEQGEFAEWVVYEYSINGRGLKVFGFTDARFTPTQAEHMAKHCLLNFGAGVIEGRKQIKQEVKDIIT